MGKYILLALKNAFRQKKRALTLGVNYTVVTLLLILVLAFSNGARVNITTNLVKGTAGHLSVSGEYVIDKRVYLGVRDYAGVTREIRRLFPESTVLKRYSFSSALYYQGVSKRLAYIGIDAQADKSFINEITFEQGGWEAFGRNPNAVIVPRAVADYFGLKNGEDVLIARRTRFGAFNTGILKIAGIHQTANYFLGDLVFCHFAYLQQLDLAGADTATNLFVYFPEARGLEEKRSRLSAALEDLGFVVSRPKSADEAISAVTAASPRYNIEETDKDVIRLTVSTLDETIGILNTVLAAVNAGAGVVAAILLFIIAVSIFINLRMTINERLQEIGTMRAMGMAAGGVTGLFVLENTLLALVFALAGIGLALLIMAAAAAFLTFPAAGQAAVVLSGGKLVLAPTLPDALFVLAAIMGFAALFSFFPARAGGRIKPVEALTSTF